MAFDLFVILYEAMAGALFLLLLVLLVLVPSRKRVTEGRAGRTMRSPLVPALIIISFSISVLMVPLAILLARDALILIITSVLIIPASALTYWDYIGTKRLFDRMTAGSGGQGPDPVSAEELPLEDVHEKPTDGRRFGGGPTAELLTVECPRCKGRIEVHPRQNSLTCPYCGLSGSI
jgi:hypothetical protein